MANYPHRIRLRGPWEFEVLEKISEDRTSDGSTFASIGRAKLPTDWGETLGPIFRGTVRYRRRFARPTGLSSDESVWLTIAGADAEGMLRLNGQKLGTVEGYFLDASFDITDRLEERNVLELDVRLPEMSEQDAARCRGGREHLPGGPIGLAALEVRTTAFLSGLTVTAGGEPPQLLAEGRVFGVLGDVPLEIAFTWQQHELAHQAVRPGELFQVSVPAGMLPVWPLEDASSPIQVKLLQGGSCVWQAETFGARTEINYDPATHTLGCGSHAFSLEEAIPIARPENARQKPRILRATTVLPEEFYSACDEAGVAIVQRISPHWGSEICRRLSCHPSIIGWYLSPEAADFVVEANTDFRPWVAVTPRTE